LMKKAHRGDLHTMTIAVGLLPKAGNKDEYIFSLFSYDATSFSFLSDMLEYCLPKK
jgi:hypothetical protein